MTISEIVYFLSFYHKRKKEREACEEMTVYSPYNGTLITSLIDIPSKLEVFAKLLSSKRNTHWRVLLYGDNELTLHIWPHHSTPLLMIFI